METGRLLANWWLYGSYHGGARTTIYRARKKDGNVKIYMDLTKLRFVLKKLAQERIKVNVLVDFVFADVNNNISMRLKNGQFNFF